MLETFPAEGSELGREGRQLFCPSRSSEIQDHGCWSLATLSLTGDTCGAPRSPTWEINNYQRLPSFLGQGIVVQALLGVVVPHRLGVRWGERPLVLQALLCLDLVCAWAVPVSLP